MANLSLFCTNFDTAGQQILGMKKYKYIDYCLLKIEELACKGIVGFSKNELRLVTDKICNIRAIAVWDRNGYKTFLPETEAETLLSDFQHRSDFDILRNFSNICFNICLNFANLQWSLFFLKPPSLFIYSKKYMTSCDIALQDNTDWRWPQHWRLEWLPFEDNAMCGGKSQHGLSN